VTRHRSFKRIVRARMAKTGESYTAARAKVLAAGRAGDSEAPVMPQSDSTLRARTGKGWERWLAFSTIGAPANGTTPKSLCTCARASGSTAGGRRRSPSATSGPVA
jgi:hypothetical protein